jgi:hypothetical protein
MYKKNEIHLFAFRMTASDRKSLGESPKTINEHLYALDGVKKF